MKKKNVRFVKMNNKEMNNLVKNLPDWAYEQRRWLAKRFKGYKYHVDGTRLDGIVEILKTDGKYQWWLHYRLYRECGKNKRTKFRSRLAAAYCIDANGRYGKWEDKDMVIPNVVCTLNYQHVKAEVFASDLLEEFRYSNISNWDLSQQSKLTAAYIYLKYPQVEFIYRHQNDDFRRRIMRHLCELYNDKNEDAIPDYIAALRLAIKHHFLPEKLTEWEQLTWLDYLNGLRVLGKDIRNPHYICPENIQDAHDWVMKKLREKKQEIKVKLSEERKFYRLKSRYIGLELKDGDLEIRTLDSAEEYIRESRAMHNCIESCKYYLKKNSLILCARVKGIRAADIELSLIDYKIIQCCGPCNSFVPEREAIKSLIYKNIDEIKRRQAA